MGVLNPRVRSNDNPPAALTSAGGERPHTALRGLARQRSPRADAVAGGYHALGGLRVAGLLAAWGGWSLCC